LHEFCTAILYGRAPPLHGILFAPSRPKCVNTSEMLSQCPYDQDVEKRI